MKKEEEKRMYLHVIYILSIVVIHFIILFESTYVHELKQHV